MHMRPRPRQEPILNAGLTPQSVAEQLRQRLAPQRWPLPLADLPADTVLVGGAVRDAALGRLSEQPDLDLVVGADAIGLGRTLARRHGGTCVVLDAERDIARLLIQGWTVDLARREGPDLVADLRRRDFTVNALALPLAPGSPLLDPTRGLDHLRRRELVAVAEANLLDDPLRLLRGVRLATELDFSIAGPSLAWIREHATALASVAGERVLAELEKVAAAPAGATGLQRALELGLLVAWGGRPAAGIDGHQLSLEAAHRCGLRPAEQAEALPLARLAWLLDGAALTRLKGSRRLQQRCSVLRAWWSVLLQTPLESLGEADRLSLHEQLDHDLPALLLSQPAAQAAAALQRWRDPTDHLFHPRAPVDGRQLQRALGLKPGPELGQLLNHLKRELAFGRLNGSNGEAAVSCARGWLEQRRPAA